MAIAGNKKFDKFIGGEVGHDVFHGKKSNGHRRRKGVSSGEASSDGSPRVEEKDDSHRQLQTSIGVDHNPEESFKPLQLEYDGVVESKMDQIATIGGDTDTLVVPAASVDASISGNEIALVSSAITTTPLLSDSASTSVPVPQPPDASVGTKSPSHKRRSGAAAISRRTTKVSSAPTRTKEETLALGLAWGPPKAPGQAHAQEPGLDQKQAVNAAIALEEKLKQKVKGFGSGTARCNDEFPWKSILNAEGEKKSAVPVQVNRIQREEKAKEIKEKGIQEYSNLPRDFIAGMEKQLDDVYGIFEDKIDYFVHDMERRTKRVAQFKRKFQHLSKKAEEASVVVVQHCSGECVQHIFYNEYTHLTPTYLPMSKTLRKKQIHNTTPPPPTTTHTPLNTDMPHSHTASIPIIKKKTFKRIKHINVNEHCTLWKTKALPDPQTCERNWNCCK